MQLMNGKPQDENKRVKIHSGCIFEAISKHTVMYAKKAKEIAPTTLKTIHDKDLPKTRTVFKSPEGTTYMSLSCGLDVQQKGNIRV